MINCGLMSLIISQLSSLIIFIKGDRCLEKVEILSKGRSDYMNEDDPISLLDDKIIREGQIITMLKYTAIHDALHNDHISVHEALKAASVKKYIHPSTGKEYTFSLRTLYRYLRDYKPF